MSSSDFQQFLILSSTDEKLHRTPVSVLAHSNYIMNNFPPKDHFLFPVPVASQELKLILKWCEMHEGDFNVELPCYDDWMLFSGISPCHILDVLCSASKLQIPGLIRVGIKILGRKTRGMSPEQMVQDLKIQTGNGTDAV